MWLRNTDLDDKNLPDMYAGDSRSISPVSEANIDCNPKGKGIPTWALLLLRE